jgi:1,4-alpha-glucan branching enzyme
MRIGDADGVHFGVWAPNADRVSVVGDFNGWDGRLHPMRRLGPTGVWEIFIPGVGDGQRYKFEIRSNLHSELLLKTDPSDSAYATIGVDVARRDHVARRAMVCRSGG